MIVVFFVPGMFGSTVEALLRSFTEEITSQPASLQLTADGSMHSFKKQYHPHTREGAQSMMQSGVDICTPLYPMSDATLAELLDDLQVLPTDKIVIVHASSLKYAELNILFQYHKIANGVVNCSLDLFGGDNCNAAVKQWNSNYERWQDMDRWEWREWFSFFYPAVMTDWIAAAGSNKVDHLKITNEDLLDNLENTFINISKYLRLTVKDQQGLTAFCSKWRLAQQYIVDEFALIDSIVTNAIDGSEFSWDSSKLSIVSEAIVQKRLRDNGYEIKCFGLNSFPNNSKDLANLLERV